MKCKKCKREIQKDFNLCPYCGYRLVPDATEIRVPEPKRKADGSYFAQVMYGNKRYTVSAPTLDEYKAKARDIKLGNVPEDEAVEFVSLGDVIDRYISDKHDKLSARTVLNYKSIRENVLDDPAVCSVYAIDWQKLVDYLSKTYSGGYIHVTWALIKIAMEYSGFSVPSVELPKANKRSTILDDNEIKVLLEHIRGSKYEAAIILALHSLRRAEILALEVEDIYDGFIHVNKEYVPDEYRVFNVENKTKTEKSTRKIPVFVDRLYEVLPTTGRICHCNPSHLTKAVKSLCKTAGLPECTPHDLRRSFASLAYSRGVPERRIMAYGGWSRPEVMYEVYVRLYDRTSKTDAQPLKDYFNFTATTSEAQP